MGIVFFAEICIKCTKYLCFLPWRIKSEHICCFFKHSYTTSGFGGHIGFLKKTVILSIFWHQLHVNCIFSCEGDQMQYNKGIRFNFWFTSGFDYHFESIILTVIWPKVALQRCLWYLFSSSDGQNLSGRLLYTEK